MQRIAILQVCSVYVCVFTAEPLQLFARVCVIITAVPLIKLFNTIALPRINIGADVWIELSIMTGVCLLTLVLVYFAHRMGSV